MTKAGRIVLLNGVGSVGKSSIAKVLQQITATPFLHVAMDAFIDMMPPSMFEGPDGLTFETIQEDGQPSVGIRTGPVAARVFLGMRFAIAAMAKHGNDLIVDDVLLGRDQAEYDEALAGLTVHWVGVFAPLDVLEARERERKDRMIGLSRWQFDRVHAGMRYDLEIDTSEASAADCAMRIKQAFNL